VAQLASATTSTPAPDLLASSSSSPIHGFHEANQPKIEFPKDAKTPHRAFRLAWCKEFHWLHYPSVEENKVFCFECCKAKELHLGFNVYTRDNFTEKGYSDWTNALNTFRKHEQSDQHRDALQFLRPQNREIPHMLEPKLVKEQQEARASLVLMLDTLLTLAILGDPIRGHGNDEGHYATWLKTRAKDRPELANFMKRNIYLSPTITTELLRCLYRATMEKLTKEIRESP